MLLIKHRRKEAGSMESFLVALNAVVPFTFYIAFGYLMQRVHAVEEDFLKKLNQMVFHLFFPFTTFYSISTIEDGFRMDVRFVCLVVSSILLLVAILLVTVPRVVPENRRRGVIMQALYRSNVVLFAVPMTQSVFGDSVNALTSTIIVSTVPLYNVVSVLILEYYNGTRPDPAALFRKLLSNPFIRGAIAGFIFHILRIHLPAYLLKPVSAFNSMAAPLALFVLGGTLHFDAVRRNLKYILPVLGIKMLLLPAIIFGIIYALRLGSHEALVYMCCFATPIATASFPMAQNLGGDGELAGQLVMLSTVVSSVTLFFWIYLMKRMAML